MLIFRDKILIDSMGDYRNLPPFHFFEKNHTFRQGKFMMLMAKMSSSTRRDQDDKSISESCILEVIHLPRILEVPS